MTIDCPSIDETGTRFPIRPPGMPAFMPPQERHAAASAAPGPEPTSAMRQQHRHDHGYVRDPVGSYNRPTILACGYLYFDSRIVRCGIECVERGNIEWTGRAFTCVWRRAQWQLAASTSRSQTVLADCIWQQLALIIVVGTSACSCLHAAHPQRRRRCRAARFHIEACMLPMLTSCHVYGRKY